MFCIISVNDLMDLNVSLGEKNPSPLDNAISQVTCFFNFRAVVVTSLY